MNGVLILAFALVYFAVAYKFYGGFISRLFKTDGRIPTPAVVNNDGVDYVPTHPGVLFGHHFASIAGAGPIIGPIVASQFGWGPALLWILGGCVFIGAVHDFAALFLSVRNGGHSIGYVIEKLMGILGRQLFLFFCWACLILVVAVFGMLVAGIFTSSPAVATASVIFIVMAPLFNIAVNVLGLSLRTASVIFVPLVFVTVYVSTVVPFDPAAVFGWDAETVRLFWLAFLGVYALTASVTPVQWLLQPRDYLSSYLLYAMLILGVIGIAAYRPAAELSVFSGFAVKDASGGVSNLFPNLFILIACGACSGFHSLVSSGTTSKQIRSENDIKLIGYGGMIVEGVLGVMSLIAVIFLTDAQFAAISANPVAAFSSGIGRFLTAIGIPEHIGTVFISLAISAFMLTSLDTSTRLGRFVWQELFSPSYVRENKNFVKPEEVEPGRHKLSAGTFAALKIARKTLANTFSASFLVILIAAVMVYSGSATTIWPMFGSSNQLLASLTLLAVTLYLIKSGANYHVTLLPTILMMVMSIWGLVEIVQKFLSVNYVITCSAIFLIVMASLMAILSVFIVFRQLRARL